jgi:hypothetical protein
LPKTTSKKEQAARWSARTRAVTSCLASHILSDVPATSKRHHQTSKNVEKQRKEKKAKAPPTF